MAHAARSLRRNTSVPQLVYAARPEAGMVCGRLTMPRFAEAHYIVALMRNLLRGLCIISKLELNQCRTYRVLFYFLAYLY